MIIKSNIRNLKFVINSILLVLTLMTLISCQDEEDVGWSYYPRSLSIDANDNLLTIGSNDKGQVILKSYNVNSIAYNLDNIRTDYEYHRYSILYPNQGYLLYLTNGWFSGRIQESIIISPLNVSSLETGNRTLFYPIQSSEDIIYFSSSEDIYFQDKKDNRIIKVNSILKRRKNNWIVQYDQVNDSLYYLNEVWPTDEELENNSVPNYIYVVDENQEFTLSLINEKILIHDRYPVSYTIENGLIYVAMLDKSLNFSFLAYNNVTGEIVYDKKSSITAPISEPITSMKVNSGNVFFSISDDYKNSSYLQVELITTSSEIIKVNQDGNIEIISIGQNTNYKAILFPFYIDSEENICGRFVDSYNELNHPNPPTLGRLSPDGTFIAYDEEAPISNPRPISEYFESLK